MPKPPLRSLGAVALSHAVTVAITVAVACAPAERTSRPEVAPVARSAQTQRCAVLVAVDGVRFQDVFLGVDPELASRYRIPVAERLTGEELMPNLHRLMTLDGASIGAPGVGEEMRASGPNFVSLPGYMEMLSGRTDFGCTNNDCGPMSLPTVADEVARALPGSAAVVSSWTGIGRAATGPASAAVVSVGRHEGAGRSTLERDPELARLLALGAGASPEPGHDDFRPDALTAQLALAILTARDPSFLFVGLGETDEYGHRNDYLGYLHALRQADRIIGTVAEIVRRKNDAGHPATLFVTTDHGRAQGFVSHGEEHPESARVFLVATGAGIEARGVVASSKSRHLKDIAQTVRATLRLPLLRAPSAGEVLTELLAPEPPASLSL